MSAIDAEEVRRIAGLTRIALTGDEITEIAADLGAISDAIAKVPGVVTPDVPAISHPVPLTNVWRGDVVGSVLGYNETLTQAPHPETGMFGVPRILGEE